MGSLDTSDGKSERDIKQRIVKAKTAFGNMKNVLLSRRINLSKRLQVLYCYVWSVLLYGCESWTISKHRPINRYIQQAQVSDGLFYRLIVYKSYQLHDPCQLSEDNCSG